ncbi:uncharacterized protein LOC108827492 isoform X2 [Raphanus sativus]|uniref:Uncharacterized protein LOC108827492 isoform X2 n=1 Tax=Raphanus sativus TaxID=3726 RepID=A0A9W3CGT3_RAPSA|nr:uncharacterized protein LOC108827492 isoform X2 [Raphanus sativus]
MERYSKCAVCYSSFHASICVSCVNRSLHECKTVLDSLKSRREVSYSRLSSLLVTKERAIVQQCWMDLHNEKLAKLRDKLELQVEKLQKSKSTFRRLSSNLKERFDIIESTNVALEKSRVRQLENQYSDSIGNHYLVYIELTSERLYKQALVMKQICKLFPLSKGSCSRIWQRDSYWNSHPSSPSDEYPLFVPSHDYFSIEGKSSWTGRDTTNFGVTSLKSDGSVEEDYHDLDVVNLSSASPQSVETFRNVQRGIAHIKQSVAHLTVYGYSSLSMEVPSGASTFETFAKLLNTLSSIKEVQSALSLCFSSSNKQRHEPNKSVWNLNSSSSSTMLNSSHIQPTSWNNKSYYNVPNRDPSSIDEWNLVEYPHFSHQALKFNFSNKY